MTTPPRTPTMREALERVLIGGNHLASQLVGRLGGDFATRFPPTMEPTDALRLLRPVEYDIWCCWREIMCARAALAAEESGWLPTHRHYKGGLYRVIGDAQHSEDGSKLIVYQGEDRRIWVRPRAMFHEQLADGQLRFSPLPSAPSPKEPT